MKAGRTQHDSPLIDALIDQLVTDVPLVRDDVVEAAAARLATGDQPTALALADTVVAHFA